MGFVQTVSSAFAYIGGHPAEFRDALLTHVEISLYAVLIGAALCLPLGVLASRSRAVSLYALNLVGVVRAVPSIAILFLAYPYLGLGFKPALLALAALAAPPILINTAVGFAGVDPAIREAAYGMGMTTAQVLRTVELPLALPAVLAGLRTATVEVVASATLIVFIGAGGLGQYIVEGLDTLDTPTMLVGAIPVALLTLAAELVLGGAERVSRRAAG